MYKLCLLYQFQLLETWDTCILNNVCSLILTSEALINDSIANPKAKLRPTFGVAGFIFTPKLKWNRKQCHLKTSHNKVKILWSYILYKSSPNGIWGCGCLVVGFDFD